MRIIFDTNFLVDAVRFKVDVINELAGNELYVLDSVIKEIVSITNRGTEESNLAKIALEITKAKDLKILSSKEKDTDKSLLLYAQQGYAIATHDSLLRNLIRKRGGKVIYIKQKKYVVLE